MHTESWKNYIVIVFLGEKQFPSMPGDLYSVGLIERQ